MKLQIAFDLLDLEKCLEVAKLVENYADSFEIRSALIYKYGIDAVEKFRTAFPEKEIFVETQIVSQPQDIIAMCIKSGANSLSVMAGTSQQIIHEAATLAHQKKTSIVLDLLDTTLIGQAAMDATRLGADAILYHNNYDSQDEKNFAIEEWDDLKGNTKLPIHITSHIDRTNIQFIISLKPDVIVIGKNITKTECPEKEAAFFFHAIHGNM